MDAAELPVPPGGVRPGHLGVVTSGRVVLGDIAATAVDLSLRGWLEIESTGGEDGGWVLASAEPPQDGQDPLEYERVLLGFLGWRPRSPPAVLEWLEAMLFATARLMRNPAYEHE